MSYADENLGLFLIHDVDDVVREKLVFVGFVLPRLGCSSIAEAVRHNKAVSLGLKVLDLTMPIKGGRGEAVKEEQRRLSGSSGDVVVVVFETTPSYAVLVLRGIHDELLVCRRELLKG